MPHRFEGTRFTQLLSSDANDRRFAEDSVEDAGEARKLKSLFESNEDLFDAIKSAIADLYDRCGTVRSSNLAAAVRFGG